MLLPHIDAIDRQILPALQQGRVVLLDRYWWSAWVYGIVGGCNRRKLRALIEAERAAWEAVRPALAVLLRRPTPIDRNDPPAYWQRLSDEYGLLAERERRVHPVGTIDNVKTPAAALAALLGLLDKNASPKLREQSLFELPKPSEPTRSTALSHIRPLKPSVVYDTYWRFAAERQEIFFRRLQDRPFPWASDQILATYKFTNAYRASDRVSQYLIRNVIYRDDLPVSADEIFFRVVLFKLFNRIDTWTTLEATLGPLTFEDYSFAHYDRVLARTMASGAAIYSAAYIMPAGPRSVGHRRKHQSHLLLLERMLADSVPQRVTECRSMQQAFTLLRSLPRHRRFSRIPIRHGPQLQRTDGFFRGRVRGSWTGRVGRNPQVLPGRRRFERARNHQVHGRSAGARIRASGSHVPIALGPSTPTH